MNKLLCKILSPEQAINLNSDLPVWFNPKWMNPIAELYKITPKVLTCYKNDNPVAFLPYYEKSFLTLRKAFNPNVVYYSPLVYFIPERKNSNRELLLKYEISKLMGVTIKNEYKRILLNISPDVYDIRGFKDAGLVAIPQYTFIKDLTNHDAFFPDEMTKLRKAQKLDYTYSVSFHPEQHLDLLYRMYSRKEHPFSIDRTALLILIKKLHKECLIEQYTITKQDRIVSSMINILDKQNSVYGWQVASEPEDMKNGVSVLMFWNVFQSLSEKFNTYDWCGANIKETSRLKAAMGAELKLFFQIKKG